MSVDKFGHSSVHFQQKHNFLEVQNEQEDILDAKKRRIINVDSPIDSSDTATKSYVDTKIEESIVKTEKILNSTLKLSYDQQVTSCLHEEKTKLRDLIKNYKFDELYLKESDQTQPSEAAQRLILRFMSDILSQWQIKPQGKSL